MKKVYLKPELEIIDFVMTSIIAASLGGNDDQKIPLSNRNENRGEWGNVWK